MNLTFNSYLNDIKTLISMKAGTVSVKVVLAVPNALRSALACVCLDLAVGSATDWRSVRIIQHVKRVPSVRMQERPHFFSCLYFRSRSTLHVGMFGSLDVNSHEECSPRVWQIPPETHCFRASVFFRSCVPTLQGTDVVSTSHQK